MGADKPQSQLSHLSTSEYLSDSHSCKSDHVNIAFNHKHVTADKRRTVWRANADRRPESALNTLSIDKPGSLRSATSRTGLVAKAFADFRAMDSSLLFFLTEQINQAKQKSDDKSSVICETFPFR